MSEIQNYNRQAMTDHFRSHYVPSNMAIAIVGDVDPEEVYRLAEKYFSRLEDHPKPRPVMIREQTPYGVRKTTIEDQAQPMFMMGFHIPSELNPDFLALDVLSSYLGSGRTSVLYKRMVKDEKIAVQVSAFVGYPASKYPTLFSFLVVPANESSNAANETAVLEEIDKVRTELIPEKELEKIKAQTKANFINGLRSNLGLASQLVNYQNATGDWRDLFRDLDRVNALTPEDIKRVAEKYLDPEKRIVVYIENPPEEQASN
jgi:predicted Zn-dependent peptidase